MTYIDKVAGTEISLQADPDASGQRTNPGGQLLIECKNRSMVPMRLRVPDLNTDDPMVAAPALASPVPEFHAPRRPNKHSARTPSVSSKQVGTWAAGMAGAATMAATVDVYDGLNAPLATAKPDRDVKVT